MKSLKLIATLIAAGGLIAPTLATAQIRSEPVNPPPTELPPPQDDNDPTPPAAKPQGPKAGITEQAGIGGTQAYGRAGVLELGGSIGFTTGEGFSQFRATPSIGWFFADNLQLSALLGVRYNSQDFSVGGVDETVSSTSLSLVVEPSYHLPFSDTVFGFLGIGVGVGYFIPDDNAIDEDGGEAEAEAGLLVSPRLGMNFLVGRSGILTPYLHVDYTSAQIYNTPQGNAVAVDIAYGGNIGYTVMW
ncbi:MAG: hypothetical protein R3F65_14560 [bacterium]